jgi:hypothetical protein
MAVEVILTIASGRFLKIGSGTSSTLMFRCPAM